MPPITTLSQLTAETGYGDLDERGTAEIEKAIEAVALGYGDATVTVTYKFKRDGERKVAVTGKVKATIPTKPVGGRTFFVTEKNNLTEDDPRQLVIKEVQVRPAVVKDLDAERKKREAQGAPASDDNDTNKKGN